MNYTKPDNEDYEDKPEDWLFCSLVFAGALGTVLKEMGDGIFVELKGDELDLHPDAKYVIVWNDGKHISIIDASERTDLKEGDRIKVIKVEDTPSLN